MLMAARVGALAARQKASVPTIVLADNQLDTTSSNQYTFNPVSLGTPSADRFIVVCAAGRMGAASTGFASIKVGGVDLPKVAEQISTGVNSGTCAIFLSDSADAINTSTDVVVSLESTCSNMSIAVYALKGMPTPVVTDNNQSTSSAASMSLNFQANGVAVGVVTAGGTAPNFTWSFLTEDVDQLIESGTTSGMASAQTPLMETQDCKVTASTTTQFAACVAAFVTLG